jgi:hypothetical protein
LLPTNDATWHRSLNEFGWKGTAIKQTRKIAIWQSCFVAHFRTHHILANFEKQQQKSKICFTSFRQNNLSGQNIQIANLNPLFIGYTHKICHKLILTA